MQWIRELLRAPSHPLTVCVPLQWKRTYDGEVSCLYCQTSNSYEMQRWFTIGGPNCPTYACVYHMMCKTSPKAVSEYKTCCVILVMLVEVMESVSISGPCRDAKPRWEWTPGRLLLRLETLVPSKSGKGWLESRNYSKLNNAIASTLRSIARLLVSCISPTLHR